MSLSNYSMARKNVRRSNAPTRWRGPHSRGPHAHGLGDFIGRVGGLNRIERHAEFYTASARTESLRVRDRHAALIIVVHDMFLHTMGERTEQSLFTPQDVHQCLHGQTELVDMAPASINTTISACRTALTTTFAPMPVPTGPRCMMAAMGSSTGWALATASGSPTRKVILPAAMLATPLAMAASTKLT